MADADTEHIGITSVLLLRPFTTSARYEKRISVKVHSLSKNPTDDPKQRERQSAH